jgi:hypothetical protein
MIDSSIKAKEQKGRKRRRRSSVKEIVADYKNNINNNKRQAR